MSVENGRNVRFSITFLLSLDLICFREKNNRVYKPTDTDLTNTPANVNKPKALQR